MFLCSSKKYQYLLHREGTFFQHDPPLWKFQVRLIHFFKCFGLGNSPSPWIYSGILLQCTIKEKDIEFVWYICFFVKKYQNALLKTKI